MCILPNFAAQDLAEMSEERKKRRRKAKAETVKMVVPEASLLLESLVPLILKDLTISVKNKAKLC
jgi:hypothetical protein